MFILAWIVVGIVAGFMATTIFPGEAPRGLGGDLIIGVIGAIIGGWIMRWFGYAGVSGINLWSFLVALLGATVLLWLLRVVTGRGVLN